MSEDQGYHRVIAGLDTVSVPVVAEGGAPLVYHKGTSQSFLDRFEDSWRKLWETLPEQKIALLTTCSHAKPYSKSYVHMRIREALYKSELLDQVCIVHVSSAGLIPTTRGSEYPFCAYDWNDAEASAEERAAYVERLRERMSWWKDKTQFQQVFAYFNPGDDNLQVMPEFAEVVRTLNLAPVPWALDNDVDDCLTLGENLQALVRKIDSVVW